MSAEPNAYNGYARVPVFSSPPSDWGTVTWAIYDGKQILLTPEEGPMCDDDGNNYAFYRREWLNAPGHGNAFIEASVDKSGDGDYGYAGGDITIKDCSRQITLSFPFSSERNRANTLAKVAMLVEVLEQFQANLLHQADLAEAAEKLNGTPRSRSRHALASIPVTSDPLANGETGVFDGGTITLRSGPVPSIDQLSSGDECDCPSCVAGRNVGYLPRSTRAVPDATGVPNE